MSPAAGAPAGRATLHRLCGALEDWGRLVLEVAPGGDAAALEQVIGGLVDWMGNELLDGWLHLPIPLFEVVSGEAEELFQASQGYLAAVRSGGPLPAAVRARHERAIQAVFAQVAALRQRGLTDAG